MKKRAYVLKGLLAGALIAFSPVELLIIAIPFCIWILFTIRSNRGAAVAISLALVVIAAAIPNQDERKRFGPFQSRDVTLAELALARAVFVPPEIENDRVTLSSLNPTKSEILQAITNQTALEAHAIRCASGASIYSGAYIGPIKLRSPKP